jgi:hypothetical protein
VGLSDLELFAAMATEKRTIVTNIVDFIPIFRRALFDGTDHRRFRHERAQRRAVARKSVGSSAFSGSRDRARR